MPEPRNLSPYLAVATSAKGNNVQPMLAIIAVMVVITRCLTITIGASPRCNAWKSASGYGIHYGKSRVAMIGAGSIPSLDGSGQGFLVRPASVLSVRDGPSADADFLAPLCNGKCAAVPSEQPIVPVVTGLLRGSSPPAIAWLVAFFIVDSVKTVPIAGAHSNVRQKPSEASGAAPFFAKADASSAIVWEFLVPRIQTTISGGGPCSIFGGFLSCTGAAMSSWLADNILVKATAAFHLSHCQIIGRSFRIVAAVTFAFPDRQLSLISADTFDRYESSETSALEVLKVVTAKTATAFDRVVALRQAATSDSALVAAIAATKPINNEAASFSSTMLGLNGYQLAETLACKILDCIGATIRMAFSHELVPLARNQLW